MDREENWDLLAACDLSEYKPYLPDLAQSLTSCWQGLLEVRHPDRELDVIA